MTTTQPSASQLVVWNEPLGSTAASPVYSGVMRATKEDVIGVWRQRHPNFAGTDQDALDEFMIVNWAWFEPSTGPVPEFFRPHEGEYRYRARQVTATKPSASTMEFETTEEQRAELRKWGDLFGPKIIVGALLRDLDLAIRQRDEARSDANHCREETVAANGRMVAAEREAAAALRQRDVERSRAEANWAVYLDSYEQGGVWRARAEKAEAALTSARTEAVNETVRTISDFINQHIAEHPRSSPITAFEVLHLLKQQIERRDFHKPVEPSS